MSQRESGYFSNCDTSGTFSNFAFEVQLTITQGDCGGMTFRRDENGHFYSFRVCENGGYRVVKFDSFSDSKTLYGSSSSAIHTGQGQQNKIAVVASGSTMTFYVNEREVRREQDSSYTSGYIGLIAFPQFGHPTDVAYSNARLWTS